MNIEENNKNNNNNKKLALQKVNSKDIEDEVEDLDEFEDETWINSNHANTNKEWVTDWENNQTVDDDFYRGLKEILTEKK